MENKKYEIVQNPAGSQKAGALVANSGGMFGELVAKALQNSSEESRALEPVEEVRRVRRGKFFVSSFDMADHGSLRRPIWEYHFHGVIVGQMEQDLDRNGFWCFGIHSDFELIPEFQKLSDWPEYERTDTGFRRKEIIHTAQEFGHEKEEG